MEGNNVFVKYPPLGKSSVELRMEDYHSLRPNCHVTTRIVEFGLHYYRNLYAVKDIVIFAPLEEADFMIGNFEGVPTYSSDSLKLHGWAVPLSQDTHWMLLMFLWDPRKSEVRLFVLNPLGADNESFVDQAKDFIKCVCSESMEVKQVKVTVPAQPSIFDFGVTVIEYGRVIFKYLSKVRKIPPGERTKDLTKFFSIPQLEQGRLRLRNILIQLHTNMAQVLGVSLKLKEAANRPRRNRRPPYSNWLSQFTT